MRSFQQAHTGGIGGEYSVNYQDTDYTAHPREFPHQQLGKLADVYCDMNVADKMHHALKKIQTWVPSLVAKKP